MNDKPSFAEANPGEFYVCQDWNHERWFQVREEMDNGDMAGRMSMQIAGGLSKEKAESVALALNSHRDLLEALEACEKEMRGCEVLIQSETWRKAFGRAWGQAVAALKKAKP